MAEIFLGVSTFFIAVLVAVDIYDGARFRARFVTIDHLQRLLRDRIDREKSIVEQIHLCDQKWDREIFRDRAKHAAVVDKLGKEFGVLEVRQRTMEKKILVSNRTVNVMFNGSIPTHTTGGRGYGKSALIPDQEKT